MVSDVIYYGHHQDTFFVELVLVLLLVLDLVLVLVLVLG